MVTPSFRVDGNLYLGASSSCLNQMITPLDGDNAQEIVRLSDNFDQTVTDTSSSPFRLILSCLTILSPNGGEEFYTSDYAVITRETHGFDAIDISFSVDGGESWNLLKTEYDAHIGKYSWDPPNVNTRKCLVKRCSTFDPDKDDLSDNVFALVNNVSTDVDESLPEEFTVYQNSPNPFNPATSISFSLPEGNYTTVQVFNVNGQVADTLVDQWREAGLHTVTWDASGNAAGMCFYRIFSGANAKVMKMMLVK